jgi:hypothetical protein
MAKVDFNVSGEGVAYYQTNNDSSEFFSQESSKGNLGLQVDVEAAVDNGFVLGYQGTFLGTVGLDQSIISNARQYARENNLNGYATTKMYLWKRLGKTALKLGRQELSQDISPLAFSEDWNVFKNTFDALVVKNEDLKDTTVIAAYINKGNGHNNLNSFSDLSSEAQVVDAGAYMLTVVNNSLKDMPITGTYYFLKDLNQQDGVSAFWVDVKSKQTELDLAFQIAYIDPSHELSKTTLLGAKVSRSYDDFGFSLAYSSVSSGGLSFQNMGTEGDVAFYTQMVNNQDHIALDAQTVVLKTLTKLPVGTLTLQYGLTKDTSSIKNDFSELDVVYKFDLLSSKMFVGYIRQETKLNSFDGEDSRDNIRVWSRYTF